MIAGWVQPTSDDGRRARSPLNTTVAAPERCSPAVARRVGPYPARMARTREAAGGGRAVEVEPERLPGWFDRFAARHSGLVAVAGTARCVRIRAADGASAEVEVPFGGLPPATPSLDPGDPGAVLAALHAHLAQRRRVGIVLVRLGGYSIGVAVDGVVEASTTGARPVHGRTRKGGSSSGRFARRRENQARVALDSAADATARLLLPRADALDAVVLGGDAAALAELRADRRLAALLDRAEPRVLDVPEPRRAVLDEAARRARSVEIVVREPLS
jgi:VLRF1 release factor-like protein